jgi:antirestriction protein ArdC
MPNYARITNPIIDLVKKAIDKDDPTQLPWRREWKPGDSIMPINHYTGRPYSGCNIINCWVSSKTKGFESNRWLTFNQIRTHGYQLIGDKGDECRQATPILFFSPEEIDKSTGEVTKHPLWKIYNVFNTEQVVGLNVEKEADYEHDPASISDAIKIPKALGVKLDGGEPSFNLLTDTIKMPDLCKFTSPEAFMSTLAHECVHSTGHKKRLDRDMTGRFGDEKYAFEELIAELGAAFISAEWGLSYKLENHAAYLTSWLKALESDPKYIVEAASKANRAVKFIADQLVNWDIQSQTRGSLDELLQYDPEERLYA